MKQRPPRTGRPCLAAGRLSLFEGMSLILGTTIGAGVLGIPFAISRVGIIPGMIYLVSIGILMLFLNLLVGELSVQTGKSLQMVGFAKHYLGAWAGVLMTMLMYLSLLGALLVYIIGEGEVLSALLTGREVWWSLTFFVIASIPVIIGLRGVKVIELLIVISIIAALIVIAGFSVPYMEYTNFLSPDTIDPFLPYGVLLFAFSGATAIPEAYVLLKERHRTFRLAIITSGVVVTIIYGVFATIVVGVTGSSTTEIATVGLGETLGPTLFTLGNIFAALAMATGFIMTAVALRDSLRWDFRIPYAYATIFVLTLPLILFLVGIRGFIAMIDIIGGVFMSIQVLLFLLIYWKAKQSHDWRPGRFNLHHVSLIVAILVIFFTVGVIQSVIRLF